MIRMFDFLLSFFGLLFCFPALLAIYVLGIFDTGSPLFLQERLGRGKNRFKLVKFRTMHKGTASVASHLASSKSITKFGRFLRRTKLDELPQLWNVLLGDMSLVGPRPNLSNQKELIFERDKLSVYNFRPGITGLAQLSGIDMSTPQKLAITDKKMLEEMSIYNYFKFLLMTVLGKGCRDAVND